MQKEIMEKNDKNLVEQDAPEKNGDRAFVQVGDDGKAVMPSEDQETDSDGGEPEEGSLKNR